jgi:hypothetical protein
MPLHGVDPVFRIKYGLERTLRIGVRDCGVDVVGEVIVGHATVEDLIGHG